MAGPVDGDQFYLRPGAIAPYRPLDSKTIGRNRLRLAAAQEQWTQSERTNNPDLVAPLLGQAHLYRY
jgi:hypothetical protein